MRSCLHDQHSDAPDLGAYAAGAKGPRRGSGAGPGSSRFSTARTGTKGGGTMGRFKHTGQRREQLHAQGVRNAKNVAFEAAENDLGRPLTPDEMQDISNQIDETFKDLPVYGG